MNFGQAVEAMKMSRAVTRAGWSRKGMFVVYMPRLELPAFSTQGTSRKVNDRTAKWIGEDTPLNCQPYFALYVPEGNKWCPGWLASQEDMLAEDWELVDA